GIVIVWAAEPAGVAKFHELDVAVRALALVERGGLFIVFGGHRGAFAVFLVLRFVKILVRAGLAQMMFFEPLITEDFRDVQRGLFGTLLALHRTLPARSRLQVVLI